MKTTTKVLLPLLLLAALLAGLYAYFLYAPKPAAPVLSAALQHGQIEVGGLPRDYAFYIPAGLPAGAPLLFVLHGSLQSVDDIRTFSAYEFERLADEQGFIVVYPQGFERNWNDCRATADYPARAQNVDDVGLIAALIRRFAEQQRADPGRAFLAGYSNGGHLGLRIALEQPRLLALRVPGTPAAPGQPGLPARRRRHPGAVHERHPRPDQPLQRRPRHPVRLRRPRHRALVP